MPEAVGEVAFSGSFTMGVITTRFNWICTDRPLPRASRFYLYMVGLPVIGPYSTQVPERLNCARRVKLRIGTGKWLKTTARAVFRCAAGNSRGAISCLFPAVVGSGHPRGPGSR
jgi:hypothetical protein